MVLDSQASAAADIANAISKSLERVVQTLETPNGAQSASPVKITLAQTATTPLTPVSPNIFLNLVIGAVLGIGFGIGGALLRETLNIRIRNERDVSLITPVAILGGIAFDEKAVSRPLVVHIDPTSPLAESFRTLRTNLQFLDVGRVDRSFVITSSNQAEGKSTIAANLAIAMADSGARVLLVDGDLRRSKVAEYMGLEGAVGLTDVLIGRVALMDAIQLWGRKQLYVLPAGHIPPNPSELLGSTVMRKLISELDSLFDVVLYDAPPLLPVTDAAILSKGVGGVVMVVAAGHTHKNDLRNSITALANVGITISGIVLTMTPTKGPDAYRYGHHAYGYFPTTAIGNQI